MIEHVDTEDGVRTEYAYDALGRQVAAVQNGGSRSVATVTHYSDKGQVDWTQDAASNRTTYTYDFITGQRIAVTDALSNTTWTAYDPQGRVLATWGATYPVAYEFDDFGRMTAMHTYRGTNSIASYSDISNLKSEMDRTAWLYDLATGLLTNKLYADGKGPSYTYTPQGQLATRTWARGVVTTYSYDPISGALTNMTYSDGTPGVSFTLDRLGRQTTITDTTGTRSFSYNDALQLAAETNVLGGIQRSYDSLGRSAGFNLGGNYSAQYGYSGVGRFAVVSNTVGGALAAATYSYLPDSDLLSGFSTHVGPPLDGAPLFSVSRAYEPNRDLIASISNTWNGTAIGNFAYANDAIARRVARVDNNIVTNLFGYNMRSELTSAIMGSNAYGYVFDPIGNRLTSAISNQTSEITHYAANALNQYTNISDVIILTPTYDLDGNMTNYGGFAYSWDAENRLSDVQSNDTLIANYKYDYMSRRYQKVVGSTTNTFLYDGWNLAQEVSISGGNVSTNIYTWGPDLSGSLQGAGGIGGLVSVASDGINYYPSYDANGNITDYVDTNGTVVAHREFDAFGKTVVATGSMVHTLHFWFSTKYLDEETGLYYYGLRYYSPETGKWINRDPLEELGGLHLYAVCLNNLVNHEDPLGMTSIDATEKKICELVEELSELLLENPLAQILLRRYEIYRLREKYKDIKGAVDLIDQFERSASGDFGCWLVGAVAVLEKTPCAAVPMIKNTKAYKDAKIECECKSGHKEPADKKSDDYPYLTPLPREQPKTDEPNKDFPYLTPLPKQSQLYGPTKGYPHLTPLPDTKTPPPPRPGMEKVW